jgi:hypothetical protein
MSKETFQPGDKVVYLRLKKLATIIQPGGLGYYIRCAGNVWAVPPSTLAPIKERKDNIKCSKKL